MTDNSSTTYSLVHPASPRLPIPEGHEITKIELTSRPYGHSGQQVEIWIGVETKEKSLADQ